MKKTTILLIYLIVNFVNAQNFKPYASAVYISQKNGYSGFYNTSYKSPNGFLSNVNHAINTDLTKNFNQINFGKVNAFSNELILKGTQVNSYKNQLGNVCGGNFHYSVYNDTTKVSDRKFNAQKINFLSNCDLSSNTFYNSGGPCNIGYQKWEANSLYGEENTLHFAPVDLTNNYEGNYTLEVFYSLNGSNANVSGCEEVAYDNNGGENFKASFTICPELISISTENGCTHGKIFIQMKGVRDGIYKNGFYYNDNGIVKNFDIVDVKDGLATIIAPLGNYKNISYLSTQGCNLIGGFDVNLTQNCESINEHPKAYSSAVLFKERNTLDEGKTCFNQPDCNYMIEMPNTQFYNISSQAIKGFTSDDNAIQQDKKLKFDGHYFGAQLSRHAGLILQGAEVRTIKSQSQNICYPIMNYKIFDHKNNKVSKHDSVKIPFYSECGGNVFSDGIGPCQTGSEIWQKWQTNSGIVNLSNLNEGFYEIALNFEIVGSIASNTSCDGAIDYINKIEGNLVSDFKATFTICPELVSYSEEVLGCSYDRIITMNLLGVEDGVYSDRFSYETSQNERVFIPNISVENGVAKLYLSNISYKNIQYWSTEGCEPTTGFDLDFYMEIMGEPIVDLSCDDNVEDLKIILSAGGWGYENQDIYKEGSIEALEDNQLIEQGKSYYFINFCNVKRFINYFFPEDCGWTEPVLGTTNYTTSDKIIISPNPASDNVNVEITEEMVDSDFNLYDLSGRILLTKKLFSTSNIISLNNLSKGTYIYRISKNKQILSTSKLIKE